MKSEPKKDEPINYDQWLQPLWHIFSLLHIKTPKKALIVLVIFFIITNTFILTMFTKMALNYIFPAEEIVKNLRILNEQYRSTEVKNKILFYKKWFPRFFIDDINDDLIIEKAKTELIEGHFKEANNTLKQVKSPLADNETRRHFHLTEARVLFEIAQRHFYDDPNAAICRDTLTKAQTRFEELDKPEEFGKVALILQLEIETTWGNLETSQQNYAEAEKHYSLARKIPQKMHDHILQKVINEYIESINGVTKMKIDRGNPKEIEEAIDELRYVHTMANDFNLPVHSTWTARSLGIIYRDYMPQVSDRLILAEHWFKKAKEIVHNYLREPGLTQEDRELAKQKIMIINLSQALLEIEKGKYKLALENLKQLQKENLPIPYKCIIHIGIAKCYLIDKQNQHPETAIIHLKNAQMILNKYGFVKYLKADMYLWRGHLEFVIGNKQKAIQYYGKSVKEYEKQGEISKRGYNEAILGTQGKPPWFL